MKKAPILAVFAVLLLAGYAYAGNLTDNGNGTLTDGATGLMWQTQDAGTLWTWQQALDYCKGLSLAGHKDWRLPSGKELLSIVDDTKKNPAVYATFFPNKKSFYWSSTVGGDAPPGFAWFVFVDGSFTYLDETSYSYVRCVR